MLLLVGAAGSDPQSINVAVIIPQKGDQPFSHDKVSPVLELAKVTLQNKNVLVDVNISMYYGDSKCTSKDAPIEAFNFYMKSQVNVFLGPVCDYSLAPVARYAPFWNLPVITPGGFAHDFGVEKRSEYPTLTRTGVTFNSLALSTLSMIAGYNWKRIKVIYETSGHSDTAPKFCFLAASAFVFYSKAKRLDNDFHIYLPRIHNIESLLRDEIGNEFAGRSELLSRVHGQTSKECSMGLSP